MNMVKQLPNVLTSLNLAAGVAGIINVFSGNIEYSIYFILIAGIFDFFDGLLARALGTDGQLGKQLDSLADMVTFGVLPAVFWYQLGSQAGFPVWITYLSILIAIFSGLRLALFNLDDDQKAVFKGVPTPANAIMIVTLLNVSIFNTNQWLYLALILVSSILMVAPIEMLSLKFRSLQFNDNRFRYILIGFLLFIMLVFGFSGLPYLIPCYIGISIISNFISER